MPSINELSYGLTSTSNKALTYKCTNVRYMTGKDPIMFRLLPAKDPSNPDTGTSFLPCINENEILSDWGVSVLLAKFCGHGSTTSKITIVSRHNLGMDEYDPYSVLMEYARSDPDWEYLTKDEGQWGSPNMVRACLTDIKPVFVANIVDLGKLDKGCMLGEFTISSAKSLYDRTSGLVFARNTMIDQNLLKQNYMFAYANGDITSPTTGPVLVLDRDTSSGRKNYAGYRVTVAIDPNTRGAQRYQLTRAQMEGRADLTDVPSFLNIPEAQEQVDQLVGILNQRSPKGYHELALMHLALPDFNIPPVPAAPGVAQTVPGFTPPQVTVVPIQPQQQPQMHPAFAQQPPLTCNTNGNANAVPQPQPMNPVGNQFWYQQQAQQQAPTQPTQPTQQQESTIQESNDDDMLPFNNATYEATGLENINPQPQTAPKSQAQPVPGIPGEVSTDDLFAKLKAMRNQK